MTTAALTAGLERIPDQLGYLVISEDGVLASAGELENDEQTAAVMMQMVRTASRFKLPGSAEPPFKRMSGNQALALVEALSSVPGSGDPSPVLTRRLLSSVTLEDFVYMVTVSGQKVFVVKRQNNQQEPIST
uniref:Ragulator complex protein LAMTOR4 n=1 Tax=Gasterosteus aculeatus aculeatus TaxID=481459 RepID=A0AAQ4RFV5_GASAC